MDDLVNKAASFEIACRPFRSPNSYAGCETSWSSKSICCSRHSGYHKEVQIILKEERVIHEDSKSKFFGAYETFLIFIPTCRRKGLDHQLSPEMGDILRRRYNDKGAEIVEGIRRSF